MAQRMIDIEDILATRKIDYVLAGKKNQVTGVSSLQEANENDLSFCSSRGDKAIKEIAASRAALIFCNSDLKGRIAPGTSQGLIFVDNPRLSFIRTVNHIHAESVQRGVSSRAVVAKSARIGSNCRIGDFAIIGEDCIVGDNTIIEDRVTLVKQCRVGRNCTIQSDVVIGHDGFAYERLPDGGLEKFPHLKGVIIGDNVDITSGCRIARGSLSDTEIGDGTKLDALAYVAHNVKIGKNCLLTGGAMIGGTARIGDQCWIGLNSSIKQKVRIGKKAIVAAGAVVLDDVDEEDIVAGIPAKSIKSKVTSDKIFMMAGQTR